MSAVGNRGNIDLAEGGGRSAFSSGVFRNRLCIHYSGHFLSLSVPECRSLESASNTRYNQLLNFTSRIHPCRRRTVCKWRLHSKQIVLLSQLGASSMRRKRFAELAPRTTARHQSVVKLQTVYSSLTSLTEPRSKTRHPRKRALSGSEQTSNTRTAETRQTVCDK